MVKYVYSNRSDREIQSNKRHQTPIIHNNVSSYDQALMKFHKANPAPTNISNKGLNIQFNETFQSTKRNYSTRTMVIYPSTPPNKSSFSLTMTTQH